MIELVVTQLFDKWVVSDKNGFIRVEYSYIYWSGEALKLITRNISFFETQSLILWSFFNCCLVNNYKENHSFDMLDLFELLSVLSSRKMVSQLINKKIDLNNCNDNGKDYIIRSYLWRMIRCRKIDSRKSVVESGRINLIQL